MTEPQVHAPPDTSSAPEEPRLDRRRTPRPVVPPPAFRPGTLIPEDPRHDVRPPSATGRVLAQLRKPKNLFPLVLIGVLTFVGLDLLSRASTPVPGPAPEQFLVHLTVSSSRPATSLFGNERYMGEIGPEGREFTVAAGQLSLRLVRSRCQSTDTTIQLQAGATVSLGPLDPICPRR